MSTTMQTKRPRSSARPFDPLRSRDELKRWTLEVFQNLSFEDAYHQQRLNRCGVPASEIAVEALLVGLFADGKDMLNRAFAFLGLSRDRNEPTEYGEAAICERLALMAWLHYRKDDRKLLKAAVEWIEHQLVSQSHTIRKSVVQRSLPTYLEAQQYDRIIRRFESVSLTAPTNLRRIRGSATMAYVIAMYRLGRAYEKECVDASLHAFLMSAVPSWLGRGHYTTAARWMKIAHWQPGDDPIATLLRCYDYLPDLKPPKYPPIAGGESAVRGN